MQIFTDQMVSTVHYFCNLRNLESGKKLSACVWLTPSLGWYFSAANPAGATGVSDGLAEQSAQGCPAD